MTEDIKAKLLLINAHCEFCYYLHSAWYPLILQNSNKVLFLCDRYIMNGEAIKLPQVDETLMRKVDPNDFCEYFIKDDKS